MMDLRMAYEGNDLAKFERTLHDKRNRITDDPFVMTYLDPLRQRIRESVLLHLTRPYQKITMAFMAGVRNKLDRSLGHVFFLFASVSVPFSYLSSFPIQTFAPLVISFFSPISPFSRIHGRGCFLCSFP